MPSLRWIVPTFVSVILSVCKNAVIASEKSPLGKSTQAFLLGTDTATTIPEVQNVKLSINRRLHVELAIFIDKEYAEKFYARFTNSSIDIRVLKSHVIDLLKQMQQWFQLPVLGTAISFSIVKIAIFDETERSFKDFLDFCNYQASLLPRNRNSDVNLMFWDLAFFFSGRRQVFGSQFDGTPVGGRAILEGACSPTDQCAGASDHFDDSSYMSRLMAHEIAHTFGIRDDYRSPNNETCYSGLMRNQFTGREWSACSIKDLHNWLMSEKSSCLDDQPIIDWIPDFVNLTDVELTK